MREVKYLVKLTDSKVVEAIERELIEGITTAETTYRASNGSYVVINYDEDDCCLSGFVSDISKLPRNVRERFEGRYFLKGFKG